VKAFAGNEHADLVSFADVELSQAPELRGGPHYPGKGGWPTIRYFSRFTGIEGGDYIQKTDDPVCTELGPYKTFMEEYVLEKLGEAAAAAELEL